MPVDHHHHHRYLLLMLLLLCALVIAAVRGDGDGGEEEARIGSRGSISSTSGLPSSSSSSSSYLSDRAEEEDNATATTTVIAATGRPGISAHTPANLVADGHAEFALRVRVRDMVTRLPLAGASVDVYVNHTLRATSVAAAPRGEVLLRVPYTPGLALVLLAAMPGYVPSPLPWTTSKRPIFSAVTILLLPHNQGNIWLFEDSVLITGKIPDMSSQPSVRFPKDLLALSEGDNASSSLTAYVTVPRHHLTKDCQNCTPAIVGSKSVYRSVELKAVAALCATLYSEGQELQLRGPIQITLPLGHGTKLRPADAVPAWAFNAKTGAWEKQGLGMVKTAGDGLVWSYTASHLGYWIAAPLPSSNSYLMGHGSSMEFLSYHTYLLVGILGGTLAILIGFLSVLVCHCGDSQRGGPRRRRRKARFSKLSVLKKDQTTSTHMEEGLLASRSVQCDPSSTTPRHNNKANYNIYVEDPGGGSLHQGAGGSSGGGAPLYENLALQPGDHRGGGPPSSSSHYVNNDEVARLRAEQSRRASNLGCDQFFQAYFQDKLILIQAPELFGGGLPQDHQQQQPGNNAPPGGGGGGCKSATFPRNGGDYDAHSEPPGGGDGFTQTLPKAPQRGSQDEPQPLETPPPGQVPNPAAWGRYNNNLLESSVSVPGTLNEAAVGMGGGAFGGGGHHHHHGGPGGELQGISERTLLELTRGGGAGRKSSSSSHPGPRAWFVSLEGRPCAQVRHSIIALDGAGAGIGGIGGRHRPPSSNDTSLDSGVDMSESSSASGGPQSLRDAYRDRPHSSSTTSSSRSSRASSLPSASSHRAGGRYGFGEEQDLSSSESGTTATCTPEDPSLRNILDGGGSVGSSIGGSGAIPNIPEERAVGDDGVGGGVDAAWSSAQEDSESRGTPPPPRRLRKVREKGGGGGGGGRAAKRSAASKHVAAREGGRPLQAKRS